MNTPQPLETIIAPSDKSDLPSPDNGPYLIATQDGYFVHDSNQFGRYLTRAKTSKMLPKYEPFFWYDIEKLPATLIGQAWSFFRAIFESKASEAMLDITWTEEHGYRLFVPPQEATHGGVDVERNPAHYKGAIVGTLHSHCDFSAFHSSTDKHDADGHDGIHFTLGMVNKSEPEIAVMISRNGEHWDMELNEVLDGEVKLVSHPKWWENFVKEPQSAYTIVAKYNQTPRKPYKPVTTAVVPYSKTTKKANTLDALIRATPKLDERTRLTLMEIDGQIESLAWVLAGMGIEFDFDFSMMDESAQQILNRLRSQDNDIPAHWRQT